MSRFYRVVVSLIDEDPDVRKINATFEMPELQVDATNSDLLWQAFKGTVEAIKDADINGPPAVDPTVTI